MPPTALRCTVFATLLLVGLAGCQSEPSPNTAAAPAATVTELSAQPEEYLGDRVTVSGPIDRVFGPASFSMTGEGDDVLVVFVSPSARVQGARGDGRGRFQPGDQVEAVGQVRRFMTAVSERDAEQSVDINYADENPALVATRVTVSSGSASPDGQAQ